MTFFKLDLDQNTRPDQSGSCNLLDADGIPERYFFLRKEKADNKKAGILTQNA